MESDEIVSLLRQHKLIRSRRRNHVIEIMYNHYDNTFSGSQLDAVRSLIAEIFSEYLFAFNSVMVFCEGLYVQYVRREKRLVVSTA